MQSLTDEDLAVLASPSVEVSAGLDLLDADLTFQEDISADLAGGTVEWGLYDDIHRSCSLQLTRALAWGVDLVRPWMTVRDTITGNTVTKYVGVFALTSPRRSVGEDPETHDVSGFDRIMLLRRQVGEDYTVTTGTTYRVALETAFTDAGLSGVLIDGSAADSTVPVDLDWPLVATSADPDQTDTPVTWLRIVNDLLRAIDFRGVFCDEAGLFRCQAYQDPDDRPAEAVFDADSPAVTRPAVGEDRTLDEDVWSIPNLWVFRNTTRPTGSPAPSEGDGIYTYPLPDEHPLSAVSRGLEWVSVVDYEAADQTALEGLAARRVRADLAPSSTLTVTTAPWPCAGHADLYEYRDSQLDPSTRRVQAVGWSLDLSGADTDWTWETL